MNHNLIKGQYDETYDSFFIRSIIHSGYMYKRNKDTLQINKDEFNYSNLFKDNDEYDENFYKVFLKKHLHYCYYCLKEDYDSRGECYFRRHHQLRCVDYCYKHNSRLIDSGFNHISATELYFNNDLKIGEVSLNLHHELAISKLSEQLLNASINFLYFDLNKVYKEVLKQKEHYSF